MPLDVQPLSPARRAVMMLVMLALLGFALGFAELLVRSRGQPRDLPRLMAPPGASEVPEFNGPPWEAVDEPLSQVQLSLQRNPRLLTAFYYPSNGSASPQTWTQDLTAIYRRMTGEDAGQEGPVIIAATVLGGRQAREMQSQWLGAGQAAFLLIRVTHIDGQALAICLSGSGLLTDADTLYFNTYCTRDVALAPERSSPGRGDR